MPWVDIDYARSVVRQMYSGDRWRSRVRHMSDDQIFAIYYKHEEDRIKKHHDVKADNTQKPKACEPAKPLFTPYQGEQATLTDILIQAEL